ncbi:hypothetical protein BCF11_1837 [Collimonas sp. PA-H2]|uniref:hypothetical protein n=1 Tax=Collimonas sp. PA-H2 TaxID=1881062 RepID=UPI000BF3947A|nr:hypothetical protein [Collimonas sp. PA-H2]PFH09441.1 hypothetical protein BCF11_1837 [Collimonas sp. PA-H2]
MKSATAQFPRRLFAAASITALLSTAAFAETGLERDVLNAPMPHEAGKGGQEVLVHYVRLQGALQGDPDNAQRLEQLKRDVASCAATKRQANQPVNLPTEWPQQLNGFREDFYASRNFSITYSAAWTYILNPDDCSVADGPTLAARSKSRQRGIWTSATLKSSAGLCQIDLVAKTARGQCAMDTHRKARPSQGKNPADMIAQMKRNPAIPASVIAQMEAVMPAASGPSKTILGIACHPEKFLGDTMCVADGGSFAPAAKLVLERSSAKGISLAARQAAQDVRVGENVFAPHLAGGFQVTELGGKP